MKAHLPGIAIVIALAACGDDQPYVDNDAGPDDQTLTSFVIDLVTNHSDDPMPVAFESFSDLPDPDGDANNLSAYDILFP